MQGGKLIQKVGDIAIRTASAGGVLRPCGTGPIRRFRFVPVAPRVALSLRQLGVIRRFPCIRQGVKLNNTPFSV